MDQTPIPKNIKKRSRANTKTKSSQKNHVSQIKHSNAVFEHVRQILKEVDYSIYFSGTAHQKYEVVLDAQEFLFSNEVRLDEFLKLARVLESSVSQIEFEYFHTVFEHILILLNKYFGSETRIDIFVASGVQKPKTSTFSEEFLADVGVIKRKHIAFALLNHILLDELAIKKTKNIVQYKKFSRTLRTVSKRYKNHMLTISESVDVYIRLVREIRECNTRASVFSLSEEEVAIYDILIEDKNVEKLFGTDVIKDLAKVLAKRARDDTTNGGIVREHNHQRKYLLYKQVLVRYRYPVVLHKKVITNIINTIKNYENKRFA